MPETATLPWPKASRRWCKKWPIPIPHGGHAFAAWPRVGAAVTGPEQQHASTTTTTANSKPQLMMSYVLTVFCATLLFFMQATSKHLRTQQYLQDRMFLTSCHAVLGTPHSTVHERSITNMHAFVNIMSSRLENLQGSHFRKSNLPQSQWLMLLPACLRLTPQ